MSRISKILLLVIIFSWPLGADAKETSLKTEPVISVGLGTNLQEARISAAVACDLAEISRKYSPGERFAITGKNGMIVIDGVQTKTAEITIKLQENAVKPAKPGKDAAKSQKETAQPANYININSRNYRGEIKIRVNSGGQGLTIVNSLPVEEYLYGVLKNEISPEWPMEALKAQAVAARNYALGQRGKHKNSGFDVCTTTDCQVYGGQDSETPRTIQAVDETRGMVLTYDGEIITAYYHSSSGGYTENSENVWTASLPYLRGVADFDQNSPNYKWEKRIAITTMSEKLKSAGSDIGILKSVDLSALKKQPVQSSDRGVSGRVKRAVFVGTKGKAVLEGSKIRALLGLNSTLFDMKIDSNKKEKDKYIIITGFGMGHGVGMSQWGAKAMAEKKAASGAEYYQEILKHYYKNTNIVKVY